MKIVNFEGTNVIFAKNQPEYLQLPAYQLPDDNEGKILCCWKFSVKERLKVLFTGVVWHQILAFKQPLQPQLISVEKPVL